MLNALSSHRLTRSLAALLATLLVSGSLAGVVALPAAGQSSGQSLVPAAPQTKDEAKQAREAADAAAAADDGGGIPLIGWFAIIGGVVIAGGLFYAFRDSGTLVAEERRAAPGRPVTASSTRGAPKGMFEGEAAPGGQIGKNRKRAKGKRQRNARKANRPR